MPDDTTTTDDDQSPEPDPDIMQYLEGRYGVEPDYEPYQDHNFVDDPPDPRPGVFYVRLKGVTLELHQSIEGADSFIAAVELSNLNIGTVAMYEPLDKSCALAASVAESELAETLEVLE